MDKTAIKNYAIWARNKLIEDISFKAALLGIKEEGIDKPLPQSTGDIQYFDIGSADPYKISGSEIKQRDELVAAINERAKESDYKTAYNSTIEEVAYTWFNRLIAIRFMEANDYLPGGIRILSSKSPGKAEPDIVTSPFDGDLEFTAKEKEEIFELKKANEQDELFRMLFIKQCNKLNEILPELFSETEDYAELLFTISYLGEEKVLGRLISDIAEEDFKDAVEIIGWIYQYYNTEPKDETFALLKKNIKITKERIPAATQLFTPDWIVRYMVENSLGRLWLEGHPNEELKKGWKYYLEEAEQEDSVKAELEKIREEYKKLKPEDIKVIDPCMGSGHILVYIFDVLMQIYESQGYTKRDAVASIVKNNLYGLDIDDRAYQLAYFATMMKAREHDRRFFSRKISLKLYSIKDSNDIDKSHLKYYGNSLAEIERNSAIEQVKYIIDSFHDAKEYGSILDIKNCDWDLLRRFASDFQLEDQLDMASIGANKLGKNLNELVNIAEVMARKYDVVVTNPPYMGSSGMGAKLSKFVKDNYPDSWRDLFAVFIERCKAMTVDNGFTAMITQHAWMFLSSFEKLREKILQTNIVNMAHLGARAFEEIGGEVVQATTFVLAKRKTVDYEGAYVRLVDYNSQDAKERVFLSGNGRYISSAENFEKIPGSPVAYWVSENTSNNFINNPQLKKYVDVRIGMVSGNNARFLRSWYEVRFTSIEFNAKHKQEEPSKLKWFPLQKGGGNRSWFGNMDYVINWENDGYELKNDNYLGSRVRSHNYNGEQQFKEGITWNSVASSKFCCRYTPQGFTFDAAGPLCEVTDKKLLFYILGMLSSKVVDYLFTLINPTINFPPGYLEVLPIKIAEKKIVEDLVNSNIVIATLDWDSFETSWDFRRHPIVPLAYEKKEQEASQFSRSRMEVFGRVSNHYGKWKENANSSFDELKANEEKLNRIFIDIYGLQDELTPEVEDRDVTITRIYDHKEDIPESMKGNRYVLTKQDVIKSLFSYAVGCMFGRYSLDVEGLTFAGGDWNDDNYKAFLPVKDNCIIITDEEYFADDIVGRFVEFIKVTYGKESLEENLTFIADALGNRGNTSREVIRNYFMKDFYKDHVKTYKKRPIYWLYDSGKEDGFKALIYMHRYNQDTSGLVRINHLHELQKRYSNEIDRMKEVAQNSKDSRDIARAEKRREKLIKQLNETKAYDEKLAHIALNRIDIDLDDGVKVNYEKVQTDKEGKKFDVLAKI